MLRVGIIGSGTMGHIHAESFAMCQDVRISSVYCIRPDSAVRLAEKYQAKVLVSSQELCNSPDVDVVVVCTPTPSHAECTLSALKAGKHVFLEKPLARNLEEGQAILRAASKTKRKLMVGHVVRFAQEYVSTKELLDQGTIGSVGLVRTARRARFPIGSSDWYAEPEQSGGVILDMLIHDMDYLRWCFGEVKRIYARNLLPRIKDHVEYALITMRFQNGVIAHLEGSWAYEGDFHTAFEIAGRKGLINFHSLEATPLTVVMKQAPGGRERVAVPRPPVNESPYLLEVQHFLESIRNDSTPAVGAKEGYKALQIALAALESAVSGKPVSL